MPPATQAKHKVRLLVEIDGKPYSAHVVEAPDGFRRAFRLTRDGKDAPVAHVVAWSAAGSVRCSCPSFTYRAGCKHASSVAALLRSRLLG